VTYRCTAIFSVSESFLLFYSLITCLSEGSELLTLDIVAQHETSAQVGLVKPVVDSSKRTWVQAGQERQ
jgi:hypothetical protein